MLALQQAAPSVQDMRDARGEYRQSLIAEGQDINDRIAQQRCGWKASTG
jgi:hypothetical protein